MKTNATMRQLTDEQLQAFSRDASLRRDELWYRFNESNPDWLRREEAAKAFRKTPEVIQAEEDRLAAFAELRRRRTNAARLANAAKRAANAVQAGTFKVGDRCHVHAFGFWYDGEVVKLGRTGKVTVRYTTGSGATREKAAGLDLVRQVRS